MKEEIQYSIYLMMIVIITIVSCGETVGLTGPEIETEIESEQDSLKPDGFYCNQDYLPLTEIPNVQIGNQTWMTENIAMYTYDINPPTGSNTSYYYDFNCDYADRGRLYYWKTAMNGEEPSDSIPSGVQGLCPDGWHIPSEGEWTILCEYLEENGYDANDLKSTDTILWGTDYPGTNITGFNAKPAGTYWRGTETLHEFDFIDFNVVYWTSSVDSNNNMMGFELKVNSQEVGKPKTIGNARSLRCLKDY